MARKRERIDDEPKPKSIRKVVKKATRKPAKKVVRKPAKKATRKAIKKVAQKAVPKPPRRKYRYAGRRPRHGLDFDTIEAICEQVAVGVPLSDVVDRQMIKMDDLHRWLQKGGDFIQNDGPAKWQIFGDFVVAFKAASGDFAALINGKLIQSDDWRCYFKIAERRFPHIYGENPQGGSDQVFSPDDQFL